MPTVALIGSYDAGSTDAFDAAVGPHAVEDSQRRVALRSGTLSIPDPNLQRLAETVGSAKTVAAELTLWDYPNNALHTGGPTEAEWIGHLRGADVLLALVAVAAGDAIGSQAERTLSDLNSELSLLDLLVLEGAIARAGEGAASGPRNERRALAARHELLERVRAALETARPIQDFGLSAPEFLDLRGLALLSTKPVAVALNVADPAVAEALTWAKRERDPAWCVVAAATESQLHDLEPSDAAAFRDDLGFTTDAATRVARAVLAAAGLLTFYTANDQSATAWLLPRDSTAVDAAGTVHNDLAAGFIRTDVASLDELLDAGGLAPLREAGRLRREGREYVVADRDFLTIHFSRPAR